MNQKIAENLRRVTRWKKDDQVLVKELAAKAKMSSSQLSGHANGHRGFSIPILIRLAKMAGCGLDDLVVGVDADYSAASVRRRYPVVPPTLVPVQVFLEQLDEAERQRLLQGLTLAAARPAPPAAPRLLEGVLLPPAPPTEATDESTSATRRAGRKRSAPGRRRSS